MNLIPKSISDQLHISALSLAVAHANSKTAPAIAREPDAFTAGILFACMARDGLSASPLADPNELQGPDFSHYLAALGSVAVTAARAHYPAPDPFASSMGGMLDSLIESLGHDNHCEDAQIRNIVSLADPDLINHMIRQGAAPEAAAQAPRPAPEVAPSYSLDDLIKMMGQA